MRALGLGRPTGTLPVAVAAAVCGLLLGAKGVLALVMTEHPGLISARLAGAPDPLAQGSAVLSEWRLVVLLLTTGLVIGFAEELLFRGVAFAALRERVGVRIGLPVSAVVFALVHPGRHGVRPGSRILLAWLYHRSGSLWSGIAVYAINNITTMLALAAAVTKS